jgi:hypothetical protein
MHAFMVLGLAAEDPNIEKLVTLFTTNHLVHHHIFFLLQLNLEVGLRKPNTVLGANFRYVLEKGEEKRRYMEK